MPSQPEKTYVLEVTMADIQAAFAALSKLPWEVANPLIVKLNNQLAAQMPRPAASDAAAQVHEDDAGDTPPPRPVATRRVQDQPDPLPRRRVAPPPRSNGAGHDDDPAPAALAEAFAEPERGRV